MPWKTQAEAKEYQYDRVDGLTRLYSHVEAILIGESYRITTALTLLLIVRQVRYLPLPGGLSEWSGTSVINLP